MGFVYDAFVHIIEQDEASTDANHKVDDLVGGVAVGALNLVRRGGEGRQPLPLSGPGGEEHTGRQPRPDRFALGMCHLSTIVCSLACNVATALVERC